MQKEVVSSSTHTPSPTTKNTQKFYFAKQHFVKKHNNLPIIPLPMQKEIISKL
jgi:hypothetical protein